MEECDRQNSLPHGIHEHKPNTRAASRGSPAQEVRKGDRRLWCGDKGRRIQRHDDRHARPLLRFTDGIDQTGFVVDSGTLLEIGKPPAVLDMKKREPGVDLVVIYPVDPDRNLAAAVRPERLWSFVAAGREFLRGPEIRYFFPPQFTRKTNPQFAERIRASGRELSAIVFKHRTLVPDVLWGQLMKLEKSMVELMDREDFHIYRSTIWSDEKIESAILLEADRAVISSVKMQKGPPVSKKEDSQSFLQRHLGARDTARGPWI